MKIRLAHVSITATDLTRLANFYGNALGFVPARSQKSFSGEWLERGMGVPGASITRVHLGLPGGGEEALLLEIIEYAEPAPDNAPPAANRAGLRHIALETGSVEELRELYDLVLEHGGGSLGSITSQEVEGLGTVTFVYMTDPEGNIIELQCWEKSA
jgi:catechol 2,3-dioxygenase-like lactoylglutathione lyase family enzyme